MTLSTLPSSVISRSLIVAMRLPLSSKTLVPIRLRPRQSLCAFCSDPVGTVALGGAGLGLVVAVAAGAVAGGVCARLGAAASSAATPLMTRIERIGLIGS